MLTANKIFRQIQTLTADLISTGLCDDQNFPNIVSESGDIDRIDIGKTQHTTSFLKNITYSDMYITLKSLRMYNFKMIDGALILMQYCFQKSIIRSHRLSFFPSPNLHEFQNEPQLYLEDDIYTDIVDKRVFPVPLRFDYENTPEIVEPIEHPVSHLTIGQYKNCRIPVNAAITPYQFLNFITRNFYHTAYKKQEDSLFIFKDCFDESITKEERAIIHIHNPVF